MIYKNMGKEVEDISKIIAVICPRYLDESKKKVVSDLLKKGDFWKAVEEASTKKAEEEGEEHKLVYDSTSTTLEPLYFYILDLVNQIFTDDIEKLIDNFTSTPGSGHFSELQAKATRMQEEAMKILGTINTVIKSIINIIYDLKEFEIRLAHYDDAKSKDKEKAEAGLLALKQIWLDNVDIKKGIGSINSLTRGELQFVTLRDAFMAVKNVDDVEKLDLNDRVKRILKARIAEFLEWKDRSEKELRKRYEIEKTYLKSQIQALQLYTRWIKPYLKAATLLEQKDMSSPDLVTAFSTIVLELTLFCKKKIDVEEAVLEKKLPEGFEKVKRKYYSCVLIDFYFRGIPERVGQHYVFGGKTEITFKSFALNEDEIKMLKEKLEESDINEALKLASGLTEETLNQLKEDIEHFLKEEEKKENKFNLFSLFKSNPEKEEKKEKKKEITPDNYMERYVRELAEENAKEIAYKLFDIFKKSHGMASLPLH